MRISDLSHHSGVSVATIKYYLREGLLPPGELSSATQASYHEAHLERLRLIRALTVSAGLPVATARSILREIDDPGANPLDLLGATHELLSGPTEPLDSEPTRLLMSELGWENELDFPGATDVLAHALAAVADAGFDAPEGILRQYGEAMATVAEVEIANIPTTSTEAAVRYVVLGTVMMEPVLLALRRLAENVAAIRRFTPERGSAPDHPPGDAVRPGGEQ